MNILPVNNNSQTNFNGRIITKGKWPGKLKEAFVENKEVKKLASGDHDIVGTLSRKKAGMYDINHYQGEKIYRLRLDAQNNVVDGIKRILGINPKSVQICQGYHSEKSTAEIISTRINADEISNKLNLSI